MMRPYGWMARPRALALGTIAIGLLTLAAGTGARAATIPYPNQGPIPPGITFTNISESSVLDAPPLYGAPTPIFIGLDFTPTAAFKATSNLGGAPDLTDGQLNYTVNAGPGAGGIPFVAFSEGGTYTLGGLGGAAVSAGASLRATVLAINGAPVAPISLTPAFASVTFSLPGDLGTDPWSLNLNLNVAGQLLGLGYAPGQVATQVEVVIDNQLTATSFGTGTATIAKEDFTVTLMPEPCSLAMAGMALCGLAGSRRRRAA